MVAGQAAMRIIKRDRLDRCARTRGGIFREGLLKIAEQFPFIGDVRGRGLMIGVEVVNPGEASGIAAPSGVLAKAIKLNCLDSGLIVESGGRDSAVLRFLPPLIVSEAEIGEILNRFEQACRKTCHETLTGEADSDVAGSAIDYFNVDQTEKGRRCA
jgi:diaminobutyrate-2-oxoglutarate transaminase